MTRDEQGRAVVRAWVAMQRRRGQPATLPCVRARNPRVVVSPWSALACVGVALLACAAIWNGAPEAPAYVVCAVALGAMAVVRERA